MSRVIQLQGGITIVVRSLLESTYIRRLSVLIAKTLNLVAPLLLVETNLRRNHNLPGPFALTMQCHLQESERVISASPAPIQLDEWHIASRDDSDYRVLTIPAFSRNSNLITCTSGCINSPDIQLLKRTAQRVLTFSF